MYEGRTSFESGRALGRGPRLPGLTGRVLHRPPRPDGCAAGSVKGVEDCMRATWKLRRRPLCALRLLPQVARLPFKSPHVGKHS